MLPPTRQLLLGAVLLTGQRSNAFHVAAPKLTSSLMGSGKKLGVRSTSACHAAERRRSGLLRQHDRRTGLMMSSTTSTSSSMQETIETRLREALAPLHLEVINESHMHSGPATESHFKVIVVTEQFEGKPLVARHRMVMALFAEEMTGVKPKMHALSIQGKTPSQWEAEGHRVLPSPPCMGGSKADPVMRDSSALGAAALQRECTRMTRREGWPARFPSRAGLVGGSRSRLSTGLLAAGLLACSVWVFLPGSAIAAVAAGVGAGSGIARKGADKVAQRIMNEQALFEKMDKAFIMFAEQLGVTLDQQSDMRPLAQSWLMYRTAWVTGSITPVAAAGVLGQPLGRAMVLTAASHTIFAVVKFMLAILATTKLPAKPGPAEQTPNRFTQPNPNPRQRFFEREGSPTRTSNQRVRRAPAPRRAPAAGGPGVTGSDKSGKLLKISVQRNLSTVPPKWLMGVTAICGPAVGAVCAAVAYKIGDAIPLAMMLSFMQGSVLGTLLAGTLCFGGAGTDLAARWAVLQAGFGALFQVVLSQPVLMTIFFINYATSSGARTGGGLGRGNGGGNKREGGGPKEGGKGGKGDGAKRSSNDKK